MQYVKNGPKQPKKKAGGQEGGTPTQKASNMASNEEEGSPTVSPTSKSTHISTVRSLGLLHELQVGGSSACAPCKPCSKTGGACV